MLVYFFIFLFVALAGFSKAVSDTLHHHWSTSVFAQYGTQSYWGIDSWVIKYRFKGVWRILFSTVLVALTDGWHTFNLVRRVSYYTAFGCAMWHFSYLSHTTLVVGCLVLMCIESFVFHIFYVKILQKKTDTAS